MWCGVLICAGGAGVDKGFAGEHHRQAGCHRHHHSECQQAVQESRENNVCVRVHCRVPVAVRDGEVHTVVFASPLRLSHPPSLLARLRPTGRLVQELAEFEIDVHNIVVNQLIPPNQGPLGNHLSTLTHTLSLLMMMMMRMIETNPPLCVCVCLGKPPTATRAGRG